MKLQLTQGFWLGKYEVTQAQYQFVTGKNPSHFEGDRRPVEFVSWEDAIAFSKRLTAKEKNKGTLPEGMEFTLPTEAQWEYVFRAGTTGPYAGEKLDDLCWYSDNSSTKTQNVGLKLANPWGFYDMHGIVLELFCQSRHALSR